jgi:hypothetical protein
MNGIRTGAALLLVLILAGCDGDAAPRRSPAVPGPAPATTVEAGPRTRDPVVPGPTAGSAQDPEPPARTGAPRTRAPAALVGTWDGDRAQITFTRAGEVTIDVKKGGVTSGTFVVDGSTMTLHLDSGMQTIRKWEIHRFGAGYGYEFFNLLLDGTSFIREAPN